jgi:hypothetical protein
MKRQTRRVDSEEGRTQESMRMFVFTVTVVKSILDSVLPRIVRT